MSRNDGLDRYVHPVDLQSGSTSYFSEPSESLDPELFDGMHLKGWVRNGLLQVLFGYLNDPYRYPETWSTVWLAGSAVSYQWTGVRDPGDLDVLIGVDYIKFRKAHPEYQGLTDIEISKMLNEEFRTHLQPDMKHWNGFEVTFYVNPGATDIRTINPYAAYDLTHDEWTVEPKAQGAPHNAMWEAMAQRDKSTAMEIISRYTNAMQEVHGAQNDAARRNAEAKLQASLMQASALFDDIHQARRFAFSKTGQGYQDFYNYRWQAGKKYGTVPALRKMSEYWAAYKAQQADETYGIDLPDTQTLIRRAATYRAKG